MDSSSLPRIRKHDDANRSSGADGGRHHSSRDHYSRDERRDRDREGYRERRRSRSPHHRSSRHEPDSYSSSRDYRAREREDRYSREPRRDDRGWERDRGGGDRDRGERVRRDQRREEDERRGPRERDPYDRGDRRGGGGGRGGRGGGAGGGERDEFAMQAGARRRSQSPPPKKREPTPDLTDVVSILDKKRRMMQWDIKPPGYEHVTAEQAKLSGMFPLPGAPRQQAVDPSRLQSLINQTNGGANSASLKPSNARQSKRLFVHNLPSSVNEEAVTSFFNLQLNGLNVIESNDPCISCQFSKDQSFALIEFKNPSDATMALALDGISMEADGVQNGGPSGLSAGLDIRRPKDYIVAGDEADENPSDGAIGSVVPDSHGKLSITNLLPSLEEEQVKEILAAFGTLKAFVLVKDRSTEESRGIAFCEFTEQSATDIAIEGLNGMELGGQHIKVQRASIGVSQTAGLEMSVNSMSLLAGTTSENLDEGRVLQLLNMVTAEELINDEDYEEIVEDVKEECEKYGRILDVKVPRPSMGSRQSNGVGKIFIKYDDPTSAKRALQSLAGRKFADRTVVTTYFSEESFEVNAW